MVSTSWRSTVLANVSRRPYLLLALRLLSYLVPLLVIISVLLPEWWHYYVPGAEINAEVVERLRGEPSAKLSEQLEPMSLLRVPVDNDAQLLAAARRLLRDKRLQLKGYPEMRVNLPLAPDDLNVGLPSWQLHLSGLTVTALLLEAYRLTGREEYFDAVREDILAWARYERRLWWPKGYIWNDHALAARALVLARFWNAYRQHRRFAAADAQLVLDFVTRTGQMLAKPSHFTYATNHGVMQNLALLHIALAFPALPQTPEFHRIAVARLAQQMEFYVNDEGVVLEHSAGYHRFGLELIGMAFRYLSWLGQAIPETWRVKYEKAKQFYAHLRRPDGSLPLFGNTGVLGDLTGPGPDIARTDERGHVVAWGPGDWRPSVERSLYPVAGYAVWWDGLTGWPRTDQLAQTVVTWSHFPGHGHKLADELSVLYWAEDQDWWTNVGYWPYGVGGRDQAISWEGSNAPHAVGEQRDSARKVQVHYSGGSEYLAAIDLERTTADGYRVRRQVVSVKGGITVVIDAAHDALGRRTRSVWRTHPEVRMEQDHLAGGYRLSAPAGRATLTAYFFGADKSFAVHRVNGEGVQGKVALEQRPTSTSAVVVDHPSNGSWAATVWLLGRRAQAKHSGGGPVIERWQNPERWALKLPITDRLLHIARVGREIRLTDGKRLQNAVLLEPVPDAETSRMRLHQALEMTSRSYPRYRDLSDYRLKAVFVLTGLLGIHVVFLVLIARYAGATSVLSLRLAAIVAWLGLGLWLHRVYFLV